MKVRTQTEIAKLDEELNLFDEVDWNFYEVLDTHETNFEYFDDSVDLDFTIGKRISKEVGMILGSVALLVVLIVGGFSTIIWRDNNKELINQEVYTAPKVRYIDGVEADSASLIEASNTLSRYFQILKLQGDFSSLDEYCVDKSDFAKTYSSYLSKMKENFDSADCYSRALTLFSESVELVDINKVIIKDDIYYVYANIRSPTSSNIEEYWYMMQFNVAKHFNSKNVSETDLERYLIKNINPKDIPVSDEIWCFEMIKNSDGELRIKSDDKLSDLCIESYTKILNKALKYLASSLTN